jgi:hypothetical protein
MSVATAHFISMHCAPAHPRRLTRPLAVVGVVAATLAVWLFASLTGVDITVRSGTGDAIKDVGPASVGVASLLAGLAAWGLLATLERVARRPRVTYVKIGLTALIVSLAGPVGLGATAAAAATLVCIHLTAATVLIPGLARSAQRRA